MIVENLPACEHGIAAHALSAWRDGDLPAGEAARIEEHLAECATSRVRLADYDALAQALRTQRVPQADERLWQAVHTHIYQTRTGTRVATGGMPRRLLRSLAAVAAVLALVLGFTLLLNFRATPHPSVLTPARATATPTPLITVSGWSQAALPAGFTFVQDSGGYPLAIAPSDGNTAYLCVAAQDANQNPRPGLSTNQIWVTHDRGVHWRRVTDPSTTPVNGCGLLVNSLNPEIVIASGRSIPLYSTPPTGTPPTLFANGGGAFSAISFNGGVTWQQLAVGGDAPSISGLFATSGGITYATGCCFAAPATNSRLMVSRDGMHTWTPVDAAIVAAGQEVLDFFYRPDTGELLAMGYGVNTYNQSLWESSDGGAHWSKLPSPATSYFDTYVAQQPVPGQPWHLCAETFKPAHSAEASQGQPTGIVCSSDGGHHWTSRPLPDASPSSFTLLGITNRGDLVAESGGFGADSLYRLPAGSDQWQKFDTPPGADVSTTFIPSPGAGVLWAIPIPPSNYSPYDPKGRVYSKDYTP